MVKFGQKLKSTDNRKYFVTSDLHFYHKRIMDFCSGNRPWNSLDEMHESLIAHWNSKVIQEDGALLVHIKQMLKVVPLKLIFEVMSEQEKEKVSGKESNSEKDSN